MIYLFSDIILHLYHINLQILLERHAHSANGGMRIPDYSA